MSGFTMLSGSAAVGPVCVDGVCAVPTPEPDAASDADSPTDNTDVRAADGGD